MNIPNALSLFRIALVPVFALIYLSGDRGVWSLAVLVLSAFTDVFDGYLARKYNQITYLGQILDPVADKLTMLVVSLAVAYRNPVFHPALYVFLGCQGLLAIGALIFTRRGIKLFPAMWPGKLATVVMYLSTAAFVGFPGLSGALAGWLVVLASAANAVAIVSYAAVALRILRGAEK